MEHFTSLGSYVYILSLDASKAFDRVNHNTLINKLYDRRVPVCLINVIANWYSKLSACVRWNGIFSFNFAIFSGVRQGSVLFASFINIYVDDLIKELESSKFGCSIDNTFFGCVMYADDLLLMSASISGLQSMLDICYQFGQRHLMILNSKKSICCQFGTCIRDITAMRLGDLSTEWVNSFKYLGLPFLSGTTIIIDCQSIKRKYYAA